MQDRDIHALRREMALPMNFELGNSAEIVGIACAVRPAAACLVPENRAEVTTEGGLDVVGQRAALRDTIARLHEIGARVSLFIDPEAAQIEAAAALGADCIELHTGAYANLLPDQRDDETARLMEAGKIGHALGLAIHAGHGITVGNVGPLLRIPALVELNIGHHLVSRALVLGLHGAILEMRRAMGHDV
jgi:pyridoxine 5-phosphate synthase